MKQLPSHIAELLDQAAARHGVDRFIARGVAWAESRGKPGAVSTKGAQGVMQLMPATAEALGVSDPFDPAANVDGGVRFLAKLLAQYDHRPEPALAGYVWGPARVQRNPSPVDWPASVRTYVSRVLARADEERAAAGQPSSSSSSVPPSSRAPRALWNSVGIVGAVGLGLLYLGLLSRGRAYR